MKQMLRHQSNRTKSYSNCQDMMKQIQAPGAQQFCWKRSCEHDGVDVICALFREKDIQAYLFKETLLQLKQLSSMQIKLYKPLLTIHSI